MTPRTPAASGLERWNWEPPCLMLAMGAFFGGPIGPRHGPEGRLATERRVLATETRLTHILAHTSPCCYSIS